jgi:putative flippase GtrA
VSALGAGVNFVVYSLLVFSSQGMAATPLVPLAIASIIALIVNYLGSKHFAFRQGAS